MPDASTGNPESRFSRLSASLKEALLMPRFWHGMLFSDWMRLLRDNRFAVSPTRVPLASAITAFAAFNSLMRRFQESRFARKAEKTQIRHAPVFIIGHWRSGTTLLHELMVLDKQYNFPTTYQCFAPNHFLITQDIVTRWLGFVLPDTRPMDNMQTGWLRPQEDEFALGCLGVPSPYFAMAFPNRERPNQNYLDMEGVSDEEIERWKHALVWFLKRVTFGDPRRIILKSPTHTARIKLLLDVFPDARFIHIARDPQAIYSSTIKLWRSLNRQQGLQSARPRNDEHEYVMATFERMYRSYFEQRGLLARDRLYEVRYEDLVAHPVEQVGILYDHLDLGDFGAVRPRLEKYFADRRDYRTNRHQVDQAIREEIATRWKRYIEEFGYGQQAASFARAS